MSDDFTPAGDYYDPSVDSSVGLDSGPTAPARGGGLFDDLIGLARQFVPGVNTAINIANRIGGVVGGLFSGGGSSGTYSAFDNQISSRSALGQDPSDFPQLFIGTRGQNIFTPNWYAGGMGRQTDLLYHATGDELEVPPIYRTNFIAADPQFTGEEASLSTVGPISGMDLAIPMGEGSIPKTLLQWLKRIAIAYGPTVASAVWVEYQKRRRSGQSGTLAKAALDAAYPVRGTISRGRRRRMNPANIRALRRAIRRVRGFKRATRKVRGLGLWGTHTKRVYARPRRRRGDLYEVEDAADEFDEAEDFDMPEGFFREDEMSEEALDY